jgi:hypothetical protein
LEDGLADAVKSRLEQFGADCDRVLAIDESDKALSLSDERIEAAIVSAGAAILIIWHLNNKGSKSAYRGLGSIAAARSVLIVGKLPLDDTMRGLVNSKVNLTSPGKSLAFGFGEQSGFTWLGDCDA